MFKHTWLIFVVATCANGVAWWIRGKSARAQNPELVQGYRSLIQGWLVFGNLPWLFMGAGIVFGGVPSIFHYFDLRSGPWVTGWYTVVVGLWIATAYWIFLGGGAEALIRHPGLLNSTTQDPRTVKAGVAVALIGGLVGLVMVFLGFAPTPS